MQQSLAIDVYVRACRPWPVTDVDFFLEQTFVNSCMIAVYAERTGTFTPNVVACVVRCGYMMTAVRRCGFFGSFVAAVAAAAAAAAVI